MEMSGLRGEKKANGNAPNILCIVSISNVYNVLKYKVDEI